MYVCMWSAVDWLQPGTHRVVGLQEQQSWTHVQCRTGTGASVFIAYVVDQKAVIFWPPGEAQLLGKRYHSGHCIRNQDVVDRHRLDENHSWKATAVNRQRELNGDGLFIVWTTLGKDGWRQGKKSKSKEGYSSLQASLPSPLRGTHMPYRICLLYTSPSPRD